MGNKQAKNKKQKTGNRNQEIGNKQTKNGKPETGNGKQEIGNKNSYQKTIKKLLCKPPFATKRMILPARFHC